MQNGAVDAREDEKRELRLWLRLLTTTKVISQEIRRRLRREFGATLPQFDVLSQLFREPDGLRLGELSKRTMVTNGNVTGLVERLETEGLVVRQALPSDRRVTITRLTDEGRAIFQRMADAHETWLKDMMSDVDPIIVSGLLAHVDKVIHSAQRHTSDDGTPDEA